MNKYDTINLDESEINYDKRIEYDFTTASFIDDSFYYNSYQIAAILERNNYPTDLSSTNSLFTQYKKNINFESIYVENLTNFDLLIYNFEIFSGRYYDSITELKCSLIIVKNFNMANYINTQNTMGQVFRGLDLIEKSKYDSYNQHKIFIGSGFNTIPLFNEILFNSVDNTCSCVLLNPMQLFIASGDLDMLATKCIKIIVFYIDNYIYNSPTMLNGIELTNFNEDKDNVIKIRLNYNIPMTMNHYNSFYYLSLMLNENGYTFGNVFKMLSLSDKGISVSIPGHDTSEKYRYNARWLYLLNKYNLKDIFINNTVYNIPTGNQKPCPVKFDNAFAYSINNNVFICVYDDGPNQIVDNTDLDFIDIYIGVTPYKLLKAFDKDYSTFVSEIPSTVSPTTLYIYSFGGYIHSLFRDVYAFYGTVFQNIIIVIEGNYPVTLGFDSFKNNYNNVNITTSITNLWSDSIANSSFNIDDKIDPVETDILIDNQTKIKEFLVAHSVEYYLKNN